MGVSLQDVNPEKVIAAIVGSKVGSTAKEEAARLVEHWMQKSVDWPDTKLPTIAAEVLWYIKLEPKIVIVGAVDRILLGNVFCEWKTRRAPKLKLDGTPYKGDDEVSWLGEISEGMQLATYALAAREGMFKFPEGWVSLGVPNPWILVRCAVKSKPPQVWPTDPSGGQFSFPQGVLDSTRNALLVKAHQIRAARSTGLVPWQATGYHCKQWGRECEFLPTLCRVHKHPPTKDAGFHATDPGYKVCELLGLDYHDPELVVLSQSAYSVFSQCMEKGRIMYGRHAGDEESFELQVGQAFHLGLASFYEQLKEK